MKRKMLDVWYTFVVYVVRIKVARRWARLVLRWVIVCMYIMFVFCQANSASPSLCRY